MNARKTVVWIVCLATVPALGGAAQAAVIVPVGGIWDDAGNEISQWRTATTPKTFDANGDNVYGSDAKLFYQVMGDYGTYIQYITSQTQVGPYGGYAVVDHPNDVSPDTQVRTTTSGSVAPGSVQNMFTFRISGSPPPLGFRVGVAFDGLDGAQYSPQAIRLTQTTGGSATASFDVEPYRNNTLDMVFFDVTEAQVGDRFTVQGVAGPGGYATHQFVTWDSITVPPSPFAVGDVIAVDFGTGRGVAANYNVISAFGQTVSPGDVIRWNDGTPVEGVSLAFSGSGGFNTASQDLWNGTDPYYVTEAMDFVWGNVSSLTLTFEGLDDSLLYNVRGYSLYNHGTTDRLESFTVTDGAGTISSTPSQRTWRWQQSTLEDAGTVFSGLRTDGSGNLVVTVTHHGGTNPLMNAIVLEAIVPEPGTWLLLLSALACGLLVRWGRR